VRGSAPLNHFALSERGDLGSPTFSFVCS